MLGIIHICFANPLYQTVNFYPLISFLSYPGLVWASVAHCKRAGLLLKGQSIDTAPGAWFITKIHPIRPGFPRPSIPVQFIVAAYTNVQLILGCDTHTSVETLNAFVSHKRHFHEHTSPCISPCVALLLCMFLPLFAMLFIICECCSPMRTVHVSINPFPRCFPLIMESHGYIVRQEECRDM